GIESETDPRTVDVHINRLRDRFKDNKDFNIITIRDFSITVLINIFDILFGLILFNPCNITPLKSK
ncbi:hypothetical protein LAV45_18250, partial [Clostridium sporogenes]|nr:hypothetical protein [Clostridium sporogenes]